MKRILVAASIAAAVAAAIAVARRDRAPASPPGTWHPVDHRTDGS